VNAYEVKTGMVTVNQKMSVLTVTLSFVVMQSPMCKKFLVDLHYFSATAVHRIIGLFLQLHESHC